jgi:hypothetical protein
MSGTVEPLPGTVEPLPGIVEPLETVEPLPGTVEPLLETVEPLPGTVEQHSAKLYASRIFRKSEFPQMLMQHSQLCALNLIEVKKN